jgi:hypothetical protein
VNGGRILRLAGLLMLTAVVGLFVFAGAWRLQGGRIERVESPSMGTTAPVGSLLWVKPVDASTLRAGDFISFRAPRTGATYSHLVRQVHPDGTISTGGALSGTDPWRLHAADVLGEVRMTWPVAGWVVEAGPVLLGGTLLLAVVVARLPAEWRAGAVLAGAGLVLAAAIVIYHPLTHAQQLAFKAEPHGARATYVGTGLLPVRVAADPEGGRVVLHNGEVDTVHVISHLEHARYAVHLSPAVPFWFWVVLVGTCFVPAVADTAVRAVRSRS